MAAIDVNQLIADIKTAATTIVGKDVTTIEGFSQTQATAMATQAAWIASGTLSGQLTPEQNPGLTHQQRRTWTSPTKAAPW